MASWTSLPEGFVLAKPINPESYDPKVVEDLRKDGRLVITRKRDGWKILAFKNGRGVWKLYTDGLRLVNDRLSHIIKELKELDLPNNILLAGELLVDDVSGNDQFTKVGPLMNCGIEKVDSYLKQNGMPKFYIFGIVDFDNDKHKCYETSFMDCLAMVYVAVCKAKSKYILGVELLPKDLDEAKRMVVKNNWEGLVLYDLRYALTYRLDGKDPKRPLGCYKWKPILEDDFIVREKIFRPNSNVLKEIVLSQINSNTGEDFYCGKLGTFNNQRREELGSKELPFVVQVKFESRYPSSKIRNARFMRVREDKKVSDCLYIKSA